MARKILLADDSVTAQNMGRKILADAGYEVITVNNGSAALKKIAEHRPDLIILDVYMPGYSGLEVCQRLKEVAETSRTPVLLTVGKLEPFKPEEAKRVRADGYIVKPFEASELLSALSKLEDKIVPRAESAKPGRLARATAAIDEGRQDKSVASEEDSSWKNRISFPSKKKAVAEAEGDESAIYNPVNKDLRTVVDHKTAEMPKPAPEKEEKVDLGALAPDGLPKDVTPEEIAALAAAAAQVKIAEEKAPSGAASEETAAPAAEAEAKAAEVSQPTTEPVADPPANVAAAAHEPEKIQETETPIVPSPADVTAAIADLEKHVEEPVTMAVSASADSGASSSSRWTAVSVALAPEETGLSLEQEMQQSFAAFASPETAPAQTHPMPAVEAVAETAAAVETEQGIPAEADKVESPAVEQGSGAEAAPIQEIATGESTPSSDSSWTPQAGAESTETVIPHAAEPAQEASAVETPSAEAASVPALEETRLPEIQQEESHQDSRVEDFAVVAAPAEPLVAEAHASSDVASTTAVPETDAPAAEVEKKEQPDIAAVTAAAWDSWRRTRETGNGHSGHDSKDEAAMAVAAGAENTPEEASNPESDPTIASIVDSMLADLRPRIVEEVSRKLGKKK